MSALEIFAPIKVNLFLEVLGRRADGYHELLTVMDALTLGDTVHVAPAETLAVTASRDDVPDGEENLAFRIVREAEAHLGRELPAAIHLEKRIPPGTGVGAGSSDAAAALKGVLELHGVDLDPKEFRALGARVGSDVPFFMNAGLAMCLGRGEEVVPLDGPRARHYVLVFGGPAVATAAVYGALAEGPANGEVAGLVAALATGEPIVRSLLHNRLEEAATRVAPELKSLRKSIQQASEEPLLSGSGSAHFLLARDAAHARDLVARLAKVKGVEVHATRSLGGEDAEGDAAARDVPAEP